jgi:hypothetical protein
VWASLAQDTPAVVAEVFDEAERGDPQSTHACLVLLDGDPDHVNPVKREAKRRKVDVHIVLDSSQVTQYFWKAASALHAADAAERTAADRWMDRHLLTLLRGASSAVASRLSNKAAKSRLLESARRELRNTAR